MKLKEYGEVEQAASSSRLEVGRLGVAILFMVAVILFTGSRFGENEHIYLLVAAAAAGRTPHRPRGPSQPPQPAHRPADLWP